MVEVGMSRLSLEAADDIDKEPANSEQVTKRMARKAELAANPPPSKVPDFLTHSQKAGKRFRNSEGIVKTAFQPSWGICDQDSIAGSSMLAMEWYRFSITPPDMVNLLARSGLEETEQLGSQAMYQMNSYFQTSIHQGRTLRDDLKASNKEKSRALKEAKEWETRAYAAEEDASSYKGKYEALESKSHQGIQQQSYLGLIKPSKFPNPWVPAVEAGDDPASDSEEEEAEEEEEEESQSSQFRGRRSASPVVGKGKGMAHPAEGKHRGVIREEKESSSGSSGSSSSRQGK
ncbi:hypothetical protein POM88_041260 [Heracleum sosnowskyi]|uniref:Uncharacterized protein n=1 Tax=Heracleum sosnowskyi TaxID=360622 RepID=A0AAD8HG21_9APIA|nr:hypothetical protein POM88_041260 [Heracleum sosnowskyi]